MSTVCAPACRKASQNFLQQVMLIFSVSRNPNCRRGRLILHRRAITLTGIMRRKRATPAPPFFTRKEPLSVHYGIGIPQHDTEGRVITLEFPDFYMVTCYTPNSQNELARLSYRMEWEDAFLSYLKGLDRNKPLILCGDLNVAHEEIDLKNPKPTGKNAGFTDEERTKMTALLSAGFTDTFRHFYPDTEGIYSWWSYRFHAREKNAGWRIDYFITSSALDDRLVDAGILTDVTGSDHCPVTLTVDLPFCP